MKINLNWNLVDHEITHQITRSPAHDSSSYQALSHKYTITIGKCSVFAMFKNRKRLCDIKDRKIKRAQLSSFCEITTYFVFYKLLFTIYFSHQNSKAFIYFPFRGRNNFNKSDEDDERENSGADQFYSQLLKANSFLVAWEMRVIPLKYIQSVFCLRPI